MRIKRLYFFRYPHLYHCMLLIIIDLSQHSIILPHFGLNRVYFVQNNALFIEWKSYNKLNYFLKAKSTQLNGCNKEGNTRINLLIKKLNDLLSFCLSMSILNHLNQHMLLHLALPPDLHLQPS